MALLAMGAAQALVPALFASGVLVLIAIVLGRVFCGWVCPLGTLFDLAAPLLARRPWSTPSRHERMLRWKYYLLAVLAVGALFGVQWVYLLDPLVLLERAAAGGLYPLVSALVPRGWLGETLSLALPAVAFAPALLLVVVVALVAVTPRFFCRYLCPLGALYGLLARFSPLSRRVHGCDACRGKEGRACGAACRMGAIPSNPHLTLKHECIRCFHGCTTCEAGQVSFTWQLRGLRRDTAPLHLERRAFLLHGAAALTLAPLVALARRDEGAVLRPPRVRDEGRFLDQCVRCAACVQACPSQTLQISGLASGIEGIWTPALTPRIGGCLPDCNACSVACPTRAIPEFGAAAADKWATKMGTALFEADRCIAYSERQTCGRCVKACPNRAIEVDPPLAGFPSKPHGIDYARCVGCGMCEYVCAKVVFGEPAIVTVAHGRGLAAVMARR